MRNTRYANGHRRRKVCAAVLAEESQCGICGAAVDVTLPPGHDLSPECDEIVPYSKGGSPYARENVRLTHRICNRRRGNGMRRRPAFAPFRSARRW